MSAGVALLRGINVGGRNTVAMADLRRVCEQLGLDEVRTYVQSGNVAFATDRDDLDAIGSELTDRLTEELGVSPMVVVRSADELAEVVAANPFTAAAEDNPRTVHVAFLPAEPPGDPDADLLAVAAETERLAAGDRVRYLHLPDGLGRSRLAAELGRRLPEATVRNWRTVTRLLELAGR